MAICISIYNRKGGVGKTSITVNLAAQLALKKRKVLLIDNDSQINLTQFFLKFNESYFDGNKMLDQVKTIYDVLEKKTSIKDVLIPLHYEVTRRVNKKNKQLVCQMDLLPGSRMMDYFGTDDFQLLKISLREILDDYDYILLDYPPANNVATMLGLVASDYLLVPIDPGDEKSIDGYSDVLERCMEARSDGSQVEILGTFFNRFMPRKADQAAAYEDFMQPENREAMGFFKETIRFSYNDVHLSEMEQVPICMIQGNGIPPIVKEYDALIRAIEKKLKEHANE